jgi:hypothetical protein
VCHIVSPLYDTSLLCELWFAISILGIHTAYYAARKGFYTTKALSVVMSIAKRACFVSFTMAIGELKALILSSIVFFWALSRENSIKENSDTL